MFDQLIRRKMNGYFCREGLQVRGGRRRDTSKIVREMLKWEEEREKSLADALTPSTTVFPTSCSD